MVRCVVAESESDLLACAKRLKREANHNHFVSLTGMSSCCSPEDDVSVRNEQDLDRLTIGLWLRLRDRRRQDIKDAEQDLKILDKWRKDYEKLRSVEK
jgi:hypothetical protein